MPAWKKFLICLIVIVFSYAIYRGYEIGVSHDKITLKPINKELQTLESKFDKIKNEIETDSKRSFSMLEAELYRVGIINTKRPVDNDNIRDINKHIQICLSAIGGYNGHCDGEQLSTYNAVIEFQSKNKLKVDGIIGKKTWNAIKAVYEKEKVD